MMIVGLLCVLCVCVGEYVCVMLEDLHSSVVWCIHSIDQSCVEVP